MVSCEGVGWSHPAPGKFHPDFQCFSAYFVFFLLVNAPIPLFFMYTLVNLYVVFSIRYFRNKIPPFCMLKCHYKKRLLLFGQVGNLGFRHSDLEK